MFLSIIFTVFCYDANQVDLIFKYLISEPSKLGSCRILSHTLFASRNEASLGLAPIHNLPDVVEELGSGILVVQIVGVLPDIDTNDWNKEGANVLNDILVWQGAVGKGIETLVVAEPAPTRALESGSMRVENLKEGIE